MLILKIHLAIVLDERESQAKLCINKRLLFDKINNEHLSTSDFLDSSIKHLSSQTNKSGKTKNTKQQNLNASFDQESKSSGSFYS